MGVSDKVAYIWQAKKGVRESRETYPTHSHRDWVGEF